MIKLTREELIKFVHNQQVEYCLELSNGDSGDYAVKCLSESLKRTTDTLLELFEYPAESEFFFTYMAERDLNPDSMETCEVEILDEDDVTDGISLKFMANPDTESPEYLKSVIKEHSADADRREEKIELLNKMIVDLERQHDADNKKWSREVMDAHAEIDRLNKLIRSPSLVEQVDELNRIIAEKDNKIDYLQSCLNKYIEGKVIYPPPHSDPNWIKKSAYHMKINKIKEIDLKEIKRLNIKIESLEKIIGYRDQMIANLERQHDADSKKWGEEVMLAHTEIDRLDKLILTYDIDRSYANERMREEEHKEYMAARDRIIELEAEIKQLQKYYDYAKTYIPQQKINKRFVTHDEPCSTNSPTSGG